MTVRIGGGPGSRIAPRFRDAQVANRLYHGTSGFAVARVDNGRWLIGTNQWGEVWLDSTDNGINLQYNANTRLRVWNEGVSLPDNGQGNGFNAYNNGLTVARSSRRVGVNRTAWNDAETWLHVASSNNTAGSRNTAVILHNPGNVDGALVALGFKVDSAGGTNETTVKHAIQLRRVTGNSIGTLEIVNRATLDTANYDTSSDVVAVWAPTGNYGVGTTTPAAAITVANGRAVAVAGASGYSAPGSFTAGSETSGGNLRQNGLYQYIIVALAPNGIEHGTPSSQIQKQLPNSGGDTWQIPLSWDAVTGAGGYRIYFRNANGSGTEAGWQYFEVGAVTSANHTNRSGTAVRWVPLGHGVLDARLGSIGWVSNNWGISLRTFGDGEGMLAIGVATTVPTSNPPNGWYIYVDPTTGDLKGRSAAGNVRTIATA